jgi:hypothetical protein
MQLRSLFEGLAAQIEQASAQPEQSKWTTGTMVAAFMAGVVAVPKNTGPIYAAKQPGPGLYRALRGRK